MTPHAPRRGFDRRALELSAGVLTLALTASAAAQTGGGTLDIYWIDVEGGAATLVVTPERESILMDTGWPRPDRRDTERILAAREDAGLAELDYVLISHFHTDHVGGIGALAESVPIGQLVDHGDSVELNRESGRALWNDYTAVAEGRRRSVAPGDKLPLRRIELSFVAAHRALIDSLESRGPNPLCAGVGEIEPDMGENGHSLGYLVSFGAFQFLNLGDLTPDREHALACPENRLGVIDLYQAPHHGGYGAIRPELTGALQPTVMVINNGPRKGGTPESLAVAQRTAGIEDVWQSHRALADNADHNTEEALIANLTEEDDCAGHWIKATVAADGRSWTMTNGRTGHTRSYLSR
ncbi:MAG: MBL fold metallo-hydrolase [Acidobacteria bacterium]|nr:MBL fold metallo-hydrolase [Acidobacteriota bacterium]MYJ04990.1 MBL fold metallo-hydrolase [Acidobacteriota bacterium]